MVDVTGQSAIYGSIPDRPSDSSSIAYTVSKSDTVPLNPVPRGIYVGTAGNVVLRPIGSNADVTYKNVPAGGYLSVRALFIRSTGTTAADMIAEV